MIDGLGSSSTISGAIITRFCGLLPTGAECFQGLQRTYSENCDHLVCSIQDGLVRCGRTDGLLMSNPADPRTVANGLFVLIPISEQLSRSIENLRLLAIMPKTIFDSAWLTWLFVGVKELVRVYSRIRYFCIVGVRPVEVIGLPCDYRCVTASPMVTLCVMKAHSQLFQFTQLGSFGLQHPRGSRSDSGFPW